MRTSLYLLILLFASIPILRPQVADTTVSDSVAMEAIEPFESYGVSGNEVKFFGDYYVPADKTVRDNIRVFGGDLHVAGMVDGKITVFGGDVNLESTAVVNGQIIAIGGTVYRKPGAQVNGKVVEANIKEGITYSEGRGGVVTPKTGSFYLEKERHLHQESWIHPKTKWFIYNRNEGFLLTPINWHWDQHGKSSLRLNLSLGWRFGQKEPAGKLTLEKGFFPHRNLIFFASAFRESRTDDYYRLPKLENSITSIVARQDFYDRWNEEGYEAGVGFNLGGLKLKLAYRDVEQDSIPLINLWSVFYRGRYLRQNRPILPGSRTTYNATLVMKTRNFHPLSSGAGFLVDAEQGIEADTLADYSRILTVLTVNWKFPEGIVLRVRGILGTSSGRLPGFRNFGVGGLGSVSAYDYKKQLGDQMLQANLELIFEPEFIDDDWIVALFADAGHAWHRDNVNYTFTDMNTIINNSLSSVGIGFGDDDMDWRVNIARPLDGRDVWETTLRLNFNF